MGLIPSDWPLLAQCFTLLFALVGGASLAGSILYALFRVLILAPPTPLEYLYARLRAGADGQVVAVGRHSLERLARRDGTIDLGQLT